MERKRRLFPAERRRRKRRRIITVMISRFMILVMVFMLLRLVFREGIFGWNHVEDIVAAVSAEAGGTVIVLDAGHGGEDPGTTAAGIYEKDINLEVIKQLQEVLEKRGFIVCLTREEDTKVELGDRAAYANEKKADLFISVHCNFVEQDASVCGFECYSIEGSDESALLSQRVITAAQEEQIVTRGVRFADYKILRETKMPAVLVELGYMSNSRERELLQDKAYQEDLVDAIAEGIVNYCS